jgi:hypothetical protein
MPTDQYEDADEGQPAEAKMSEFDCPSCSANNPYDTGFAPGDEVLCYYCGARYLVKLSEGGRVTFREI